MVATFAIMLMAVLVVRAPVAALDRLQHVAHQSHAADAFSGPLEAYDHQGDHNDDREDDHHDAPMVDTVADDAAGDAGTTAPHHHHHDASSVYGLSESVTLPIAWPSATPRFKLDDDLRKGVEDYRRDRPPKPALDHVA